MSIIPKAINDACIARGLSQLEIDLLSPRGRFNEYCEWHGLINWGDTLWNLMIESLHGAHQWEREQYQKKFEGMRTHSRDDGN